MGERDQPKGWRTREAYEQEERTRLAPWAACAADSVGRLVPEPEHAYRTAYQRDRDRIVHSRAFRRLEFKTQVFVHRENDHYRNRLTHTIEAAQITRTIARALRLNEDLAEAIVLAHDLGHTPFGHAGEAVLHSLMKQDGGFDHNRQSLRIVDLLEDRYPEFSGLNLTAETREGILKHGCDWPHPVELPTPSLQRPLEAQVADYADEIAYTHHDLDDGLRSGVLSLDLLAGTTLWKNAEGLRRPHSEDTTSAILRAQTIGALGDALISDLIEESSRRIDEDPPESLETLRLRPEPLIGFRPEVELGKRELKDILATNFYHHPEVLGRTRKAEWIVGDLFRTFRDDSKLLPARVRARFGREGKLRAVSDYIAGMTDRFAVDEHRRLFDPHAPI